MIRDGKVKTMKLILSNPIGRRKHMSKSIFRIGKSAYYSNGIKDMEEYSVCMHSKLICSCLREELIELRDQLNLALDDQVINVNEKRDSDGPQN